MKVHHRSANTAVTEQVHYVEYAGTAFHQVRSKTMSQRVEVHLARVKCVLDQELPQFSPDCIFADSDCTVFLVVEKKGMRPVDIHICS